MAVELRRPILVGGIGLSFALWVFEALHAQAIQLGEWTVLGIMGAGAAVWWWQKQAGKPTLNLSVPLDRATVEKAIATAETTLVQLESETETLEPAVQTSLNILISQLRNKLEKLPAQLDRQQLEITVIGGRSAGKTSLIKNLYPASLQTPYQLTFTEAPALFTQNELSADITNLTQTSDLVLLLIPGDLTEPEYQTLQQLKAAGIRSLLLWNKQDQYIPEERTTILQLLQQRLKDVLPASDILPVCANPAPVKVRRHQDDGSVAEWQEQPNPDILPLTDRLTNLLETEAQTLIFATTLRQVNEIKNEAKTALNELRKNRAMPIIEQSQWIAAAAAFANPVPALDLLATGAITAQLVVDLGEIYQQKFSVQQGQAVAGTLANFMVKLGLVELSTKTLSTILKSNAMTYLAGGIIQGVSAAYLTRIAGLSLIEYFQNQEVSTASEQPLNVAKLSQTLQAVFQQNQQVSYLQSFVKPIVAKLKTQSPHPETAPTGS